MAEKKTIKKNNTTVKSVIGTMLILVLSIAVFVIADMLFSFKNFSSREEAMVAIGKYLGISTIVTLAMLVLSVYLTYIYLKDYLELKSRFTLGILLAIISFMMFSITSNPFFHMMFGVPGKDGIFELIPLLFATISLGILAWISSR